MKNSFKLGVLALAMAVSFAACKGSGSAGSKDSDTTKKADTTAKMAADTSKKDTSKMKMAADTTKKDTSKKK